MSNQRQYDHYGCYWCGEVKHVSQFPPHSPPALEHAIMDAVRNPHVVGICMECEGEALQNTPWRRLKNLIKQWLNQ